MGGSVCQGWVCSLPVRHCRRAAADSTGTHRTTAGQHGKGGAPRRSGCWGGSQTSVLPEGTQQCSEGCLLCTGALIIVIKLYHSV